MLNLLPKDQKEKISREYKMRFFVVASALALVAEIISLILLVPSYLTTQTRLNVLNSESVSVKVQNLTAESSSLANTVQQTNNYLSVLISSSTPVGVVASLENIIAVRGSAVRIGGFFYRTNNGQQQIVVSGNANTRKSLLEFANKLKNQPGVISADLPVSDFAQAQDIDFSVNVLMKPQNI